MYQSGQVYISQLEAVDVEKFDEFPLESIFRFAADSLFSSLPHPAGRMIAKVRREGLPIVQHGAPSAFLPVISSQARNTE